VYSIGNGAVPVGWQWQKQLYAGSPLTGYPGQTAAKPMSNPGTKLCESGATRAGS